MPKIVRMGPRRERGFHEEEMNKIVEESYQQWEDEQRRGVPTPCGKPYLRKQEDRISAEQEERDSAHNEQECAQCGHMRCQHEPVCWCDDHEFVEREQ
jgi:hypothetical protein